MSQYTVLHDIYDVARELDAGRVFSSESEAFEWIGNRLYKATESGVSLTMAPAHLTVWAYCEGSDADLPSYDLFYPFKVQDLWNAVGRADADGIEEWNRTHGCEKCAELWGGYDPVDGMPCEGEDGITPVHPQCPECQGNGVII